jgi:protein-L-isoaspartate(D-aspartate) O-methyltransferase
MMTRSFTTQRELVKYLQEKGVLHDPIVKDIMLHVDRGMYAPPNKYKYEDRPQQWGLQITISAPHMHARTLELMRGRLVRGARCLDVGSGSGYLLACMKRMVGSTGTAVGIEINEEMAQMSLDIISNDQPGIIEGGGLHVYSYDGMKGCLAYAPYDAIHVGAALNSTPQSLLYQLKIGGVLVCPLKLANNQQKLMSYKRESSDMAQRYTHEQVRYVDIQ